MREQLTAALMAVLGHLLDVFARLVVVFVLGAVVFLVAYWYFGIYDTAAGKCDRGDLGACMVYQAQQDAQRP